MCVLVLLAVGWFAPPPCRAAAEEIRVPFGFRWGDSPQTVEQTIGRAKANVVERRDVGGRKAVFVDGLPDPKLQRAVFYFEHEALVEVELQYDDPSWDTARATAIFEATRRNLDRKYGTSRNIARQRSREGDTTQTVYGYQWTQPYTSLRLFLYLAERGNETFRMLSYHYRSY